MKRLDGLWLGILSGTLVAWVALGSPFSIEVSGTDVLLSYPSDSNSYYIIRSGTLEEGFDNPLDISLGSGTLEVLMDAGILGEAQSSGFYQLVEVPQDQPLDSDNDGIHDIHELAHPFLDPFDDTDAAGDFDNDGFLDKVELIEFGTDPAASNALVFPPRIMGLSFRAAQEMLHLSGLSVGSITVVETIHNPAVAVISPELSPHVAIPENASIHLTISIPADPNRFIDQRILTPFNGSESNSLAYYAAIDPLNEKTTLAEWIEANDFGEPGGEESEAAYFNEADLGFGREMYMRQDSQRIAFYVTNYKTANEAAEGNPTDIATVCMEFSSHPLAGGDPYIKFYTFNGLNPDPLGRADTNAAPGARLTKIDLDGRGNKFQPGMCMTCHGGLPQELENGAYPNFGRTASRFIPFDIASFTYPTLAGSSRVDQEDEFKVLNNAVLDSIPEAMPPFTFTGHVPIPDNDIIGVNITNPVAGVAGVIADLNFSFDGIGPCSADSLDANNGVNHSFVGDLVVQLTSPEGTTAIVMFQKGGGGNNICNMTYDDEALAIDLNLQSQVPPYTGLWSGGNLGVFDGENPNGSWILNVSDRVAADTGFVNQWSLHIVPSERTGAVAELLEGWYGGATLPTSFDDAFVPTNWLTPESLAEGGDEVYSEVVATSCRACHMMLTDRRPDLDFNSFSEFAARRGLIADYVYCQGLMPMAKRTFDKFWLSHEPSQSEVLARWIDAPGRFSFSAGSPLAIPDPGDGDPLSVQLEVIGFNDLITDLDVSFDGVGPASRMADDTNNGITHTYVSDLVATLTSPAGTSVRILDRVGGAGSNIFGLRLDDDAPASLFGTTASQAPYSGAWKPSNPLSAFQGENAQGIWMLTIEDTASADVGSLQGWSLHFNSLGETKGPGAPIAKIAAPGVGTVSQSIALNGSGSLFAETFEWDLVSAPPGSSAVIVNGSLPEASLVLDDSGIFRVKLTIQNAHGKSVAVRDILVENVQPQVTASTVGNTTNLFPATIALDGQSSDDGLPLNPGQLSFMWEKCSGPGSALFADALQEDTSVAFTQPGLYELCLTVSDGDKTNSALVEIFADDAMVIVGDAGNPADPTTGLGAVSYDYRISSIELTIGQYARFLNAVAASDPLELYEKYQGSSSSFVSGITRSGASGSFSYSVDSGMELLPVSFVRFFDVVRYVNWLHNGATDGADTESGGYQLLGGTVLPSNANAVTRSPGAKFWIPDDHEWYKAAYYQPFASGGDSDGYWLFAGQANILNSSAPPGISPSANFWPVSTARTPVGSYVTTTSYYGTFDQSGNAWEMTDTLRFDIDGVGSGFAGCTMRGGGNFNSLSYQQADYGGHPQAFDTNSIWSTFQGGYGTRIAGAIVSAGGNTAPEVNAGSYASSSSLSLPLAGSALDDGLPGGSLSSTWSKVSGPGSVTFDDASVTNTTAHFSEPGAYTLRLTATDGELTSFSQANITVLVSFENVIIPMLTNPVGTCVSCHNDLSPNGGLSLGSNSTTPKDCLTIYNHLSPGPGAVRVNTSNPASSRLLDYPANGSGSSMGPVVGFSVGSANYNQMLLWIQQGALNDCP